MRMKSLFLAPIFLFLFTINLSAQGGVWTWMRGGGGAVSPPGSYGTQGISSPTNDPPCRYMCSNWVDTSGNFWIFGGFNGNNLSDTWKYDVQTNEWTWMKGGQGNTGQAGTFGVQGVPALSNNPPANSLASVTWTDLNNNLWLYHKFGDLWKYEIATNTWTWVKGSGVTSQPAVYGTKGVPSSLNTPGSNVENKASWTDSTNHLWLYNKGDMWRYDILSNEWTWMRGDSTVLYINYGVMGIPADSVEPHPKDSYTHWTDMDGNFYIGIYGLPNTGTAIWKYHTSINQWSWESGDSTTNATTNNRKFISQCTSSTDRNPGMRLEARGVNYLNPVSGKPNATSDSLFWFFGGAHSVGANTYNNNNLWYYNHYNKTWKWVSGDSTNNPAGSLGVMGVPDPSNMPCGLNGDAMWVDHKQQIWIFGGQSFQNTRTNNVWRFTPDTCCVLVPPTYALISPPSDTDICINTSTFIPMVSGQNYSIQPSSGYVFDIPNQQIIFQPTVTTSYTVTATKSGQCSYPTTIQFTIHVYPFPSYTYSSNDTICDGQSATLTAASSASVQFLWLPSNSSNNSITVNPTTTTTYTLVAQAASSGCPNDTNMITVYVSHLVWNLATSNNLLCAGQNNGSLQVQSINGVGTVSYTLMPGSTSNITGQFLNVGSGVYTITATDGACSITTSLTITSPLPIQQNSLVTVNPDCNATNGQITANYTGGTGTLTYSLLPAGGSNSTGLFNGLSNGNYTMTVKDANNCSVTTVINLVNVNAVSISAVNTTPSGCNGNNSGTATIQVANGIPPFQYSIGGGFVSSSTFSNLSAGNYTATVSDSNNCTSIFPFTIIQIQPPHIVSTDSQSPLCINQSNGQIQVVASGNSSIVTYQLLPNNILQTTGQFNQLASGNYTVIATDAQGCTVSTEIVLISPEAMNVLIANLQHILCRQSNTGLVQFNAQGTTPPVTYTVSPPGVTNSSGLFENLEQGHYRVVLKDAKGCIKADSFEIKKISCCDDVMIPNAFSPNGDQMNDVLRILNSEHIQVIKFVVANRWGNIVFNTNLDTPWDGKIKGGDAENDTYYYFLKYKCLTDGAEYMKKGDVILMR